jgi:hypothetical protein
VITITGVTRPLVGSVDIPADMNGLPVTTIGNSAFSGQTALTQISIPASITHINYSAFSGCSNLQSISFTGSSLLNYIGQSAFANCTSLTSIDIPEGTQTIDNDAFHNCTNLLSIIIPSSVDFIGTNVLTGCNKLTSISIPFSGEQFQVTNTKDNIGYLFGSSSNSSLPTSLKTVELTKECLIKMNAFKGCTNLTSVIFNNATSISSFAFYGCSKLTNIIIPNSVLEIGQGAFFGCNSLNTITIPFVGEDKYNYGNTSFSFIFDGFVPSSLKIVNINGNTPITSYAFNNCSNITTINIGSLINSIAVNSFYGCSSLKSITVASNNQTYDSRYYCNAIIYTQTNTLIIGCKNTVITSGITSIGASAFSNCTNLTSIYIPTTITTIGANAFDNCYNLTIYLQASSIPNGYNVNWNSSNCPYYLDCYTANITSPSLILMNTYHIDTIHNNEIYYYKFTALVTGWYTIYTEGPTNTRGELFVYTNNQYIRIKESINGGNDDNFSFDYLLYANEEIYIKVSGYNGATGYFVFIIEKATIYLIDDNGGILANNAYTESSVTIWFYAFSSNYITFLCINEVYCGSCTNFQTFSLVGTYEISVFDVDKDIWESVTFTIYAP